MSPEYLADRMPVLPMALLAGDLILTIHTEGEPGQDVDWWVVGRQDKRDGGKTIVTVTYEDVATKDGEGGEAAVRTHDFVDPDQWLSVARPEPDRSHFSRHARAAA